MINLQHQKYRKNRYFVWLYTTLYTDFGDKMHKRCLQCRGQKFATGLGGLRKRCVACNGVGYVDMSEDIEHDEDCLLESCDEENEQSKMESQERDVEATYEAPPKKTKKSRGE